jgi:hypothetical protein
VRGDIGVGGGGWRAGVEERGAGGRGRVVGGVMRRDVGLSDGGEVGSVFGFFWLFIEKNRINPCLWAIIYSRFWTSSRGRRILEYNFLVPFCWTW